MPGKQRTASHRSHCRHDSANSDCEGIPTDSQPDLAPANRLEAPRLLYSPERKAPAICENQPGPKEAQREHQRAAVG